MTNDISLTLSQRRNLLTLDDVSRLSGRTEQRLATGREINSVLDGAVTYFRAQTLTNTANDFDGLRQNIDQGISALNAFLNGVEAIEELVQQLRGIAEGTRSQTDLERASATTQFRQIGLQINNVVEDTRFQGIDLLARTSSQLTVRFGTRTSSTIVVGGLDLNATVNPGGSFRLFSVNAFSDTDSNDLSSFLLSNFGISGGFTTIGSSNSNIANLTTTIQILENSIDRVRGHAAYLGNNVSILQVRLDFTRSYVNDLSSAADKLVLADLNEEGANLVSLQTRQQLGIQALRVSNQNQQAILQLLN